MNSIVLCAPMANRFISKKGMVSEMAKWNYELKCGKDLRAAIDHEDYTEIFELLKTAYRELANNGYIDGWELDAYIEDLEIYGDNIEDDEEAEDTINYELNNLYDLCDALRVWISL